eukprot:14819644-Alexandrium_andersonii.AAC.1
MDWVMFTRLGACSARGRGGGAAASCGTRGITCGWPPPADADSRTCMGCWMWARGPEHMGHSKWRMAHGARCTAYGA